MSDEPPEPFGATYLGEWRAQRLQAAKSIYDQILDKLWLSNGAGAAAVFTRAGDLIKDTHSATPQYLWPLGFFVAGAVLPILGNAIALFGETFIIYEMESARGILELKAGHAKRPSKQASLTLKDPRTITALLSACCLVIGGIWGFCLLDYFNG